RGRTADVVLREIAKTEFAPATAFPQESDIEPIGEFSCLSEELGARWALERKQDARSLYFRASAVRAFDLK
ncbi:MAG TPA: hypothetical protein VJT77_10895, partial [Burkholderiales bacterium]|nr:hypothetical protein [Burkholderiales bacterium]